MLIKGFENGVHLLLHKLLVTIEALLVLQALTIRLFRFGLYDLNNILDRHTGDFKLVFAAFSHPIIQGI
jgi:hypothetical protein